MNTYYLRKFRKRYSYIFKEKHIFLLDHKTQSTEYFFSIRALVSSWISEHVGFIRSIHHTQKKHRRAKTSKYHLLLKELK